jgi:hypothetical protein
MRAFFAVVAAVALLAGSASDAAAKQCRDAKGKFIKCPAVATAHCKDPKTGKFVKCTAPGAVKVK